MPKIKLFVTALLLALVQTAFAQGTRISGTVTDDFGPVMMANVVERDANNRIVTAAVTDVNGNFSMVVKNTKNNLTVSYVGSKPLTVPIGSKTHFALKLGASQTQVKEITVTSRRRTTSGGLSIPAREVSVAQQSMDMADVEGLSFTSADEALQGKIAGLDIVASSGNLGSGTQMRLRGVTSINGNKEPLIVVDDQIFDAPDFDPETATEEDYASLLSVNVEDIASINVLKDAASTAIWGSRGANGVIEIKTKRGARGKTRVNFSYKFMGSWQPSSYTLLNGDQYSMFMKEALYNVGQVADATTDINELNYVGSDRWMLAENWNNNTDWVDAVTQFGQSHSYNVNLTGGGEKANFRISAAYDHQTGTIIKQTLNRFTTRMALDYFVSDRITFTTNFAFSYTNNNKNYSDLLSLAQRIAPNMSVYRQRADGTDTDDYYIMNQSDDDGTLGIRNPSSAELDKIRGLGNPIAIANLAWAKENVYRINPDFRLKYDLLGIEEGKSRLTYTGSIYFDIYSASKPSYWPSELGKYAFNDYNNNRAYGYESNSMNMTITNAIVFTPHFNNEDWYTTMRFRYQMVTGNSSELTEYGYLVPPGLDLPTLGSLIPDGKYASVTGTGETKSQNWSYTAHLSYKSRYSLGVTIRADGDSKFGPDNKWAYFPAVSGRWNISDEPFFKPLSKVVNMLAFRPSWGMVGNAPSSESLFYELYNTQAGNYGPSPSVPITTIDNLKIDDLKWETTKSYNLGADLELFNSLISAKFEYYYKTTSDLLMKNVPIPTSSGYSVLPYANVGSMTNEGWELVVDVNDFLKIGKFKASANFNISQNYNEITEMDEAVLNSVNTEWVNENGNYMNRAQVGNPLGSIYGYRYKGVYQYSYEYLTDLQERNNWTSAQFEAEINNRLAQGQTFPVATDANGKVLMQEDGTPKHMVFDYQTRNYQFKGGDAIYEDINHDGEINELDVVYLGNSLPKVEGGFGLTLEYDRWTLRANFNFRFGAKVVNTARMNLENMSEAYNQCASVNYRWRKDGDQTMIPRAVYGSTNAFNWLGSDRYVEDASFVRFQYLQLTYNMPAKFAKSLGLNNFKIYLSANNLYCWTKYSGADPEHAAEGWGFAEDDSKTPRSKSFTVGINIGF